jgi:hypothetical protein
MPTGAITDVTSISTPDWILFDTTPETTSTSEGSLAFDNGDGTLSLVLKGGNVTLPIGQENVVLCYNGTGSTLSIGQVVAVVGAQGQRPSIALADADSEPLSAATLGVVSESIANGAEGFVTTFGIIKNINTSAFAAGDAVYLSQTAGGITATRPAAPAHTVFLGWILKVNASSGELFLNINNGWELDELHNVLINSPTTGQSLVYNATTGVWQNSNAPVLSSATGLPLSSGVTGTLAVANGGTGATTASGALSNLGGLSLSGGTMNAYANLTFNLGKITAPGFLSGLVYYPSLNIGTVPTGVPYSSTTLVDGDIFINTAGGFFYRSNSTTYQAATLAGAETLTNKTITGLKETKTAISASNIDLSAGNYFTKTISGATTFTVSNVASSGSVGAFVLDLTNGGAATVTWWSGITWNAATAPTLTASGVDTLAFFTYDGGTTWRGFVLGQGMA